MIKNHTHRTALRVLLAVAVTSLMVTTAVVGVTAQSTAATTSVDDVEISTVGETGEASVVLDVGNGLSAADVTVSVDTSIAEISGVSEGEDINSNQNSVEFEVVNQSSGSVTFQYTAPQGASVTEGLQFATVEFQAVNQGQTEIGISTNNFNDQSYNEYGSVNQVSGTLSVESDGEDEEGEDDGGGDEQEGNQDEDETEGEEEATENEEGNEQTQNDSNGNETQAQPDGNGQTEDTGDNGGSNTDSGDGTDAEGIKDSNDTETDSENRTETSQGSTVSDTKNGTDTNQQDGGQGLPGFGVIAALTAMLSVGAYRRIR